MTKTIRRIEAQIPITTRKKRVAAYARVSLDTERLENSLSAQISYYSAFIQRNPSWEYAGVFADNGISGTSTDRTEFQRLMAECEAGHIDIILTKSISRFARNTLDTLTAVRRLRELGIEVQFEKEHIHTLSDKGELLLTLLASFAQEESRSISENVKWGVRKRMKKGIPNGRFRILGYRWQGDKLVIVPEEAAVVRRIYQDFLNGKSRLETERALNAEGIRTINGCRFQDSSLKVILTNVTYTGNLLLQKEYITDPINGKRRKNHGELPQYYVENTHEAIIDQATFDYVQQEMTRRKALGAQANKSLNLTCFSGKIKCPYCHVSYMSGTSEVDTDTMNRYVSRMVEEALKYNQVESILDNGEQEDIFSLEYFEKLSDIKMPATKLEMLVKMLRKQITEYGRTNQMAARRFQEMLEETIKLYHERRKHLTAEEAGATQEEATEEIIKKATEQALQILKEMNADRESFRKAGLTFEEKAFYDILMALRDQYNFEYDNDVIADGIKVNDKCRMLAMKIKEIIDTKSSFADWLNNQIIRDQLKFDIKVCLIKNGYPPQYSPEVFRKVMEQVENFEENS